MNFMCPPQPYPSPGYYPGCTCQQGSCLPVPTPPLRGPIMGVTDGSDAKPGEVGELLSFSVQVNFTSGTQIQVTSMGALSAGDWDCWCAGQFFSTPINLCVIYLSPIPTGFGGIMSGVEADINDAQFATVICNPARALVSVPTLVAFTSQIQAAAAGSFNLAFAARRRR